MFAITDTNLICPDLMKKDRFAFIGNVRRIFISEIKKNKKYKRLSIFNLDGMEFDFNFAVFNKKDILWKVQNLEREKDLLEF